jgi:hypothetical protein
MSRPSVLRAGAAASGGGRGDLSAAWGSRTGSGEGRREDRWRRGGEE